MPNSTSRRSILDLLMGIGTFTALVGAVAPVLAYLAPLRINRSFGNTLEAKDGSPVPPDSLTEGKGLVGRLGGRPILAVKKNGQILGFSAVCTHLGCIVRWNLAENRIECPCHGGQFDLQGAVIGGPPPEGIQAFVLKIEGDRIVRG